MKTFIIILVIAAILGFIIGLFTRGSETKRNSRITVQVHVPRPRPRGENAYQRAKRKQAEERKAYHDSEWRQYGDHGLW